MPSRIPAPQFTLEALLESRPLNGFARSRHRHEAYFPTRHGGFTSVFCLESKSKILPQSKIIQISRGFWQIHRDSLPGWVE
jgi:hypothetical protein